MNGKDPLESEPPPSDFEEDEQGPNTREFFVQTVDILQESIDHLDSLRSTLTDIKDEVGDIKKLRRKRLWTRRISNPPPPPPKGKPAPPSKTPQSQSSPAPLPVTFQKTKKK